MWKLDEMLFSVAEMNEQLRENVMRFKNIVHNNTIRKFVRNQRVREDWHAGESVADVIENFVY